MIVLAIGAWALLALAFLWYWKRLHDAMPPDDDLDSPTTPW